MEKESKVQEAKRRKISYRNSTIPIIVDNTIDLPDNKLVRLVYFSIDATEDPKPFRLKVGEQSIPFLMIGFQGIIHTPLNGTRFLKPESIENLFNAIEKSGDFFVDTNDLWIPLSIFSQKPSRGDVFRITRELFSISLKYRYDKIELGTFFSLAQNYEDQLFLSVNETKAFTGWSLSVIREAIDISPKNAAMQLIKNYE